MVHRVHAFIVLALGLVKLGLGVRGLGFRV
jgi:hypothetical protein